MYIKCLLKTDVAFKIIIRRVIDQIVVLKTTSFLNEQLTDT
jgi:hypothetical protein